MARWGQVLTNIDMGDQIIQLACTCRFYIIFSPLLFGVKKCDATVFILLRTTMKRTASFTGIGKTRPSSD